MPLFSKRKSGKSNSKGAKHAGDKEGATLLANNLQKPKDIGVTQQHQQHFNGVPQAIQESNNILNTTIQRPPNSTAKCVSNFPRRSRLSKSLPEVLVDDSVLPLFMEYLQKQNAPSVLNFWLAAETFCLSCRDKKCKSRLKEQPAVSSSSNIQNISCMNESKQKNSVWERNGEEFNQGDHFQGNGNNFMGAKDNSKDTLDSLKNCSFNIKENLRTNSTNSKTLDGDCFPNSVNKNDNYNTNNIQETSKEKGENKAEIQSEQETTKFEKNYKEQYSNHSKTMMDDAISIYRHFISLDATQPLNGMDENIRRDIESNICSEDGQIDPNCFKVAQQFAFETLETRYFDGFLRSSYYQKHIMDILTSGKVFLADIMYNDDAVFYFMEFMEQEGKSYLLAFWFAVDSFRQELQSKLDKEQYNVEHALSDAMVLYDKYFSMQATQSLGVGDETRIRIENKICREGGPLPDCFEEPMENILTLLEEVYFPIFLESSVYFKYLNELFNSVGDIDTDQSGHDDRSSITSACETSKLLESLTNDAELQEDPDEIWQRPNIGLSIGRVNEYGIYEPWIEPQPGKDQKSKASFGQKMREFVSGDSYKVKEEMAWQVAKMVLEDVKKQQRKASK